MDLGDGWRFRPQTRERVCSEWRKSTTQRHEEHGCKVEFDAEGCLITKVECGK
jgi:hypothetical protein